MFAYIPRPGLVGLELVPDDGEVWLVCGQPQHDEVGVRPTQAVVRVGVVVRLRPLSPYVVHDLVFPFPGRVGVRQDHLRVHRIALVQVKRGMTCSN